MALYRPVFIAFVGFNTAVLGILVILISLIDPKGNIVHYIGKLWSRMNLIFSGVQIHLAGEENILEGQSYVVMSNHQSHYDVWALIGYLPLQLRWVMKKELRKIPIFGFACGRMGHIYIDRGNAEKSHEELQALRDKFASGASVVFFPEGSRSEDGILRPFKKGALSWHSRGRFPYCPLL